MQYHVLCTSALAYGLVLNKVYIGSGSNSSLLDAFFYGKAFAETLNEKLGTALDEALASFGKQDAERREALR